MDVSLSPEEQMQEKISNVIIPTFKSCMTKLGVSDLSIKVIKEYHQVGFKHNREATVSETRRKLSFVRSQFIYTTILTGSLDQVNASILGAEDRGPVPRLRLWPTRVQGSLPIGPSHAPAS